MWILCLAEDSLETSSLIFSEKQWKNIYEYRLLQLLVNSHKKLQLQSDSNMQVMGLLRFSVIQQMTRWQNKVIYGCSNLSEFLQCKQHWNTRGPKGPEPLTWVKRPKVKLWFEPRTPWHGTILDPGTFIWTNLVKDHCAMLYTKF